MSSTSSYGLNNDASAYLQDRTASYSRWHTPSSLDHATSSFSHSAFSEPLPFSPQIRYGHIVGFSLCPCYEQCPAMCKHAVQGTRCPTRSVLYPDLPSLNTMAGSDDSMSISSVCGASIASTSSGPSSDSWDQCKHSGSRQCYTSLHSGLKRSSESLQHCRLLDDETGHILFPPTPLVVPNDYFQPDFLSQPLDLQHGCTTDQATSLSSSFDSFYTGSHCSNTEVDLPMHEYFLPEDGESPAKLKLDSPSHDIDLSGLPWFSDELVQSPKFARGRNRSSLNKRGQPGGHQLVKAIHGYDITINPETMEADMQAGMIKKKNVDSQKNRWECRVAGCGSRAARKEHLRRHELSHQPEKQFHCNLPKCGRAITRTDNLIQHLMTHARPPKPGKRNAHHSRERIVQMVQDTMTDKKLADRTIANLGKAIDREADKWPGADINEDS